MKASIKTFDQKVLSVIEQYTGRFISSVVKQSDKYLFKYWSDGQTDTVDARLINQLVKNYC